MLSPPMMSAPAFTIGAGKRASRMSEPGRRIFVTSIVFVALMIGVGLLQLPRERAKPLLDVFESLNGVVVRQWFERQGIAPSRLDIFTSGYHARRSRDLYRLALGEQVTIGVIASQPPNFDPARWWRTSDTGKVVAVEFAAWFLIKCCFNPGEPGSHLERWGMPKRHGGAN